MLPAEKYQAVAAVISWLRQGKTLTAACRWAGVSRHVIVKTIRENEELRQDFNDAIAESEDMLADILVDIDEVHSDPKMAGVVSKNIQWLLSRRRPKDYGDRITVNNEGGTTEQAILGALRAAIDKIPDAPRAPEPPMLDVTPVPVARPLEFQTLPEAGDWIKSVMAPPAEEEVRAEDLF